MSTEKQKKHKIFKPIYKLGQVKNIEIKATKIMCEFPEVQTIEFTREDNPYANFYLYHTNSPTANCQISSLGSIEYLINRTKEEGNIAEPWVLLSDIIQKGIIGKRLILIDVHKNYKKLIEEGLTEFHKIDKKDRINKILIYTESDFVSTNGSTRKLIMLKIEIDE